MSPTFLTEADVEARNAEFQIARLVTADVCVYLYRGKLAIQCRADDACDGECDAKCHHLVKPGTDLIFEVYNRADTSIWFVAGEDVEDAQNVDLIVRALMGGTA